MGSTATMYRFQVEVADIDRGVYESLSLHVAQHPSEDLERLVVRVLARVLAHEERIEFGRGVSNPEDAGLWVHGLTGQLETWIDIGLPAAERLHKASKKADRVMVFTHKSAVALRKEWRMRKIHRAEAIRVIRFSPELIEELVQDLSRRETWFVNIHHGQLSVAAGDRNIEGAFVESSVEQICSASS